MLTLEMVLMLSLYTFIVYGIFFGPNAILTTFRENTSNLAGQVERSINIPTAKGFNGEPAAGFQEPTNDP